jgi:two-component system, NtrC family, response regulator AtoC
MAPSLHILLVDDEEIIHQTIGDYLRECGHRVESEYNGAAALQAVTDQEHDLALVDVRMPGMDGLALLDRFHEKYPEMSVVIITGHGDMDMAVQALRLGAVDFLKKPIKLLELDGVLEKALRVRHLRQDRRRLRETIGGMQTAEELRQPNRHFVGVSGATCRVRQEVELAARADTVLVTGETGTGKEVVAREIHFQSAGNDSPFIAVSCPALPGSLVESELFGHVKGAFTGATESRAGYFELADGGTLFLDEVGDLAPAAQAKLLRVLETRSVRRVGGDRESDVDVRVIAATNVGLQERVEAGEFRADLFYRLDVFSIHLPPLRERTEDIAPLAEHFLATYGEPRGLRFEGFSGEAVELLISYPFPGNARELRNVVERAAILCGSGRIQVEQLHLPERVSRRQSVELPADEDEAQRILKALESARWNRRQAARELGMPYSTLRYKIQRLSID